MLTVDGKEYSIQEMMRLKKKPKVFYKYHLLNNYFDELITKSEFHMQSHLKQNDFLDCKYEFTNELLEQLLLKASMEVLDKTKYSMFKEKYVHQVLNSVRLRGQVMLDLYVNSPIYFTCFSASAVEEHMWSHYGDGHKGIRLGFDFSSDPEILEHILPVIYTDKIPIVDSLDSIGAVPYFKRSFYKVEEEWRVCISRPDKLPFNKSTLKEIRFGCRVSHSEQKRIINLLDTSGYDLNSIKVTQMQVKLSGITIPFDRLDDLLGKGEK